MINALDHGVYGDGVTDDTAAINAILSTAPPCSKVYFPDTGNFYLVSGTLDCGTKPIGIVGDHQGKPLALYDGGTHLIGSVAGPIWKTGAGANGITFSDLAIRNHHATGVGIDLGGESIAIERVAVSAYQGIRAAENCFTTTIRGVKCVWVGNTLGSVGIMLSGHASVQAADIQGYDHGIRACGQGVDIRSCRIEVNRKGLVLGIDPAGASKNLTGGIVQAIWLEANDVSMSVNVATGCQFAGISANGTVASPSAGSAEGFRIFTAANCDFMDCTVGGRFSGYAVKLDAQNGAVGFARVAADNTLDASRKWFLPSLKNLSFQGCS